VYIQEWECKKGVVSITAGQKLGIVGDTGTEGGVHLHFEVRNFPDLIWDEAVPPDGFAYTHCFPNEDDYKDPSHYLDGSYRVWPPYEVTVTTAGDGQSLRLGPNSKYRNHLYGDIYMQVTASEELYVQQESAGQAGDSCSKGWAEVTVGPDSGGAGEWPGTPPDNGNTTFWDIGYDNGKYPGENYLPDLWICKGNGSTDYVVRD
jgi:hypothetical protein